MLLLNPFKGLSLSNEECFENTIGFKCICLNVSRFLYVFFIQPSSEPLLRTIPLWINEYIANLLKKPRTDKGDYNQSITCPCDNCINGMINNLCVKMKREQSVQPRKTARLHRGDTQTRSRRVQRNEQQHRQGNSTVVIDPYYRLESRLPGEISVTSHMQMAPPLWQKVKRS